MRPGDILEVCVYFELPDGLNEADRGLAAKVSGNQIDFDIAIPHVSLLLKGVEEEVAKLTVQLGTTRERRERGERWLRAGAAMRGRFAGVGAH